jgi:hypothetical protein
MNWYYERHMSEFTKHINKRLSHNNIIDTWGIYVSGSEKYLVYVEIDYINDFHSRDSFRIEIGDLDSLKGQFDILLDKHIREFKESIYRRDHE